MGDVFDLAWPALLAPAVVTALLIRADAKIIGPYWSFTELIPGLEGVDADLWYERPALLQAIVRRYAYVALASGIVTAAESTWGVAEAALLGVAIAGLLLWPIVFHGLPYGILRRDWQLLPLYGGVVMSFISAAVVGCLGWGYIEAQADGEPWQWLRGHFADALFWSAAGIVGTAFFRGSLRSLRATSRKRTDSGDT
jgi:hypothetical protein